MKPRFFAAILPILLFLTANPASARIEKGLSFRSYEVPPNLRTSLVIPADKESPLKIHRNFILSFDLKIDTEKECFGYVCRMLIDGQHNVDVILTNPVSGMPYLGVATVSGELEPLRLAPRARIGEWNRIRIALHADGTQLAVEANGAAVDTLATALRSHSIVVCFGSNNRGRFATSDVAPMTVRNVALTLRDREQPDYCWKLEQADEVPEGDRSKRLAVDIRNAEWLVDRNTRWRKIEELSFASKVFPVTDPYRNRILFVAGDRVTLFQPGSGRTAEYRFAQNIRTDLITNDFIILPDGQLLYYDLEGTRPVINRFDFAASRWERSLARSVHSKYLHHNKFFNPADSSVVQLFGYGFHRYLNESVSWRLGSDTVRHTLLTAIPPRYLSGVGFADSVVYIYGGKGNDKGIQEFGATIYNDLYRCDLRDGSVLKLWDDPAPEMKVAASDLVVAPDGRHFTALFYHPNIYQSQLQLKEYTIADGHSRTLADTIPYDFIDVDSDAGLLFDDRSGAYYAVVVGKVPGKGYRAAVYTIQSPILSPEQAAPLREGSPWFYLAPLAAFAAAGGGVVVLIRCRKRRAEKVNPPHIPLPEHSEPRKPGIYLLGGFRVIDREGRDITSNFTPVMRQLLVLIILHSDKRKGISNAELKEAFWSDKSEESYYNNRGVNIRKIRTWLTEVGAAELVSANGSWHFTGDRALCDYLDCTRRLEEVDPDRVSQEELAALIGIARRGTLLPDMRLEWFDRFKAAYADKVIELLGRIRDNRASAFSPETRIRLADAILIFDSLDEDSIRVKCRALIQLKRLGIAQNVFNNFIQEYKRLMGEDFGKSFNAFTREPGA